MMLSSDRSESSDAESRSKNSSNLWMATHCMHFLQNKSKSGKTIHLVPSIYAEKDTPLIENKKLSLKTYLLLSLFSLVFFDGNPVNIFAGTSVLSTSLVALFSAFWLSRNKNCGFSVSPSEALSKSLES